MKGANQLSRDTRQPFLPAAAVAIVFLILLSAPKLSEAQLVLRKMTEDETAYRRDPAQYDRVDVTTRIYFVEKAPALTIPVQDIESVIVETKRTVSNFDEELVEIRCEMRPSRCPQSGRASGEPYYAVTFTFSPGSTEGLAKLTRQEKGNQLEMKLGSQVLSLAKVIEELSSGMTFYRSDITEAELKAILAQLNDKVTWK